MHPPEIINLAKSHVAAISMSANQGIPEPLEIKENNAVHQMMRFAVDLLEASKGRMNKNQLISALRQAIKAHPLKSTGIPNRVGSKGGPR